MSVYIDLTEFLNNPVLTGIQRVTAEICRWWPDDTLRPVRLTTAGNLVELPGRLIEAIARCFKDTDGTAVREVRALKEATITPVSLDGPDMLLVPEVFYDSQRIAFFRSMGTNASRRLRFIVYDLMPLLHPEYFAPDISYDVICGYFSMIRQIPQCGFISKWTQETYCRRLLRSRDLRGVVLRLGSDGLGSKAVEPLLKRPLEFCVVGTIEPRKNHALVLDAFEPLLRSVEGLRLTFLGRLGWADAQVAERIQMAAGNWPGFAWLSDADDNCIRQHVERARATVYVSAAEGFGLPPVESLWLGTPVIASRNLPSLEEVGSGGVHVVDPLDAATLRDVVRLFLDDSFAEAKAREASAVALPTWASFARQVAKWCNSGEQPAAGVSGV
jgi:glycosyltransferase involved in cell wall biosynthesis